MDQQIFCSDCCCPVCRRIRACPLAGRDQRARRGDGQWRRARACMGESDDVRHAAATHACMHWMHGPGQLPALGRWDPAPLFTTQLGASYRSYSARSAAPGRSIDFNRHSSLSGPARGEPVIGAACACTWPVGLLHAFRSLQYQY